MLRSLRVLALIVLLSPAACSSVDTNVPDVPDVSDVTTPDSGTPDPDLDASTPSDDAEITPDAAHTPDASVPPDASDEPDAPTEPDTSHGDLVDDALLAALRNEASSAMNPLFYNAARDAMYAVGGIDDHNGRIEAIYTGRTVDTDGSRVPSGNCQRIDGSSSNCAFNTEHVFAQKHLRDAFGDGSTMFNTSQGDIHHLFPSDAQSNQERGNFDFGNSDCLQQGNCAFNEESQLGLPVGGTGPTRCPSGVSSGEDLCVFQVRPERRGDIARAIFYMSMRYELPFSAAMEADLRGWHASDPPDARERERNDRIEAAQGNRNPFVDHPELVDRISRF